VGIRSAGETVSFFSSRGAQIQDYADVLSGASFEKDLDRQRAELVKRGLQAVLSNLDEYDEFAVLTASNVGERFDAIVKAKSVTPESIKRLLSIIARFARETTLKRKGWLSEERDVLDYFLSPTNVLEGDELLESDYLKTSLPGSLLDLALNRIEFAEKKAKTASESIERQVGDVEQRISGHRAELKKIAEKYNFVGLADAFRGLIESKSLEKWVNFSGLITLGLLALAPLLLYFFSADKSPVLLAFSGGWSPVVAVKMVAGLGYEILMLYFFRIFLRNFVVTRQQLTNLQMRLSLCSFIEGYMEFAKKIGQVRTLESFESFVFSPLSTDASGMPATIEGLEQITALVKAARG